ncbi:MAG: SDR family NAD(P)-dependent oxidoreductase [Christensenellaceae bacterium]|jgi:short-subunit dehydrogenase|nr:SDR family NAD(P)-dependent oxidoreductase [Christensenellaceae bacterium]
MKIAVVTGASSGMGREFVFALDRAEPFDEIWVIARREDRLAALQQNCRAAIRPLPLDLLAPDALTSYAALLKEHRPEVAVLVNASGFGRFALFAEEPLAAYNDMLDVNAKALMGMTYVTLPYLQSGGRIYQLGSLSSFQPVPYIAVYGASKAFVLSFSRALNVELRPRGIRSMAVCPGWVKTEFFDHALTDQTAVTYFNRFYTPEAVVRRAIKDMARGKDVSIAGFPVRFQVLLTKILPHKFVMWVWMKQQGH